MGSLILGIGFLYWAIVMLRSKGGNSGMKTFQYSIIYLMVLFAIMLVDHYLVDTVMYLPAV
jgi:protoheme IX farnesyltransferase